MVLHDVVKVLFIYLHEMCRVIFKLAKHSHCKIDFQYNKHSKIWIYQRQKSVGRKHLFHAVSDEVRKSVDSMWSLLTSVILFSMKIVQEWL